MRGGRRKKSLEFQRICKLPYISTFGGSQNALLTKPYMQFGDRLRRFPGRFSASVVSTPVVVKFHEMGAIICPKGAGA